MSASLHDIKSPPWTADAKMILRAPDPLLARAKLNYPDSEFNQAAWLKAIGIVRSTSRGWKLDHPLIRGSHA